METVYKRFVISDDKEKLQIDRIREMLSTSYWARDRSMDVIQKTIDNSICFGIYQDENQVGFARCVTDYSTMYWLGDVIIDCDFRGLGLGKALMKAITQHDELRSLRGILETDDAHDLYKQYDFYFDDGKYMIRKAQQRHFM